MKIFKPTNHLENGILHASQTKLNNRNNFKEKINQWIRHEGYIWKKGTITKQIIVRFQPEIYQNILY